MWYRPALWIGIATAAFGSLCRSSEGASSVPSHSEQTELPQPAQAPSPPSPGLLPLDVVKEIETAGYPRPPALLHGELLTVVSQGGFVESFSITTGEMVWKLGLPGQDLLSPQMTPSDMLLAATEGRLYFVDPSTGSPLEELATPVQPGCAPAVQGRLVFLASLDGEVAALDRDTRSLRWRTRTGEPSRSLTVGGRSLIVSGAQGTLTALDTASGIMLWELHGRGAFESPASFDSKLERLYVGDGEGTFYCLNAQKGTVHYRWETGAAIPYAPLVEADRVFVAGYSNTLFAFRADNGHELWRSNLPGRPASGPVRAGSRLVVAIADGIIVEVDPVGGRQGASPYMAPSNIRSDPSFRPPNAALCLRNGKLLLLKSASSESPHPETTQTEVSPRPARLSAANPGQRCPRKDLRPLHQERARIPEAWNGSTTATLCRNSSRTSLSRPWP